MRAKKRDGGDGMSVKKLNKLIKKTDTGFLSLAELPPIGTFPKEK